MSNPKFSDEKGNCSKEIGDPGDVQNHGSVNNQILDLHQTNRSGDGANTFPLGTPTNGVPFPSMNNQPQASAERETQEKFSHWKLDGGAFVNVENKSLVIFETPSNENLRKREADMKDFELYKKEIDDECKRLKNANTSLEDENVYWKGRCTSMEKSLKRQKKMSSNLEDKYNELTVYTTALSMIVLTQSEIQLQERIVQLEASDAQLRASNAQLRARNAQLENETNAREVNEENDRELDRAEN